MAKSTKVVTAQRVKEVTDLYLLGYTPSKILQYSSDKGWGVSLRQIHTYMERAQKIIAEINQLSIKESLEQILAAQWELYNKTIKQNNPAVARMILVDIAKMKKLIDTQSPLSKPLEVPPESKLTNEELTKALEALKCPAKS